DYAAAVAANSQPATKVPSSWVVEHREAFLAGYLGKDRDEKTDHLLAIFELDRALYEAVYEYHNRPDWVDIPIRAIRRIIKENAMNSQPDSATPITVEHAVLEAVSSGQYFAPHDVLGGHIQDGIVTIR